MIVNEIPKNVKPEVKGRTLLTIQGETAKIDGKFVVSKSIEIDCEVKGKLDIEGQIIIQKNGFVNADVKTTDAEIIGRFDGSMEARGNVEIKESGVVYGNLKTDSLIISKGGIFCGNVTRITDAANAGKKPPIDPLSDLDSGKDDTLTL
jgi:cytoskeletal protein CcmA (bactofilin family)